MTAPALSVVVPSVNGWSDLSGCLAALEAETRDVPIEILVADRLGDAVRSQVRQRFHAVRVLEAEPGTTIPDLRALAFEAATGPAVAVIEDHVLVPRGWARAMLAALDSGEDVLGGGVENAATGKLVDWAAFLCEYSQLLPPLPAGPVDGITGNNTLYRRSVLARYRDTWRAGRWENHLHDAMRRDGIRLYQHPEIVVGHKMHYTVGLYLSQRFIYARSYAGARVAGAPRMRRLAYGAAALLLPPILFRRVVGTVWAKRRHRKELLRSLPLLALFVTAWGAGEMVGYWFGPGDALSRVR